MEARPLPGTPARLAPLGLALPPGVRDPIAETRLARAYAGALPTSSGRLLVDLGEGPTATLRESLWAATAGDPAEAPVLLTHESRLRGEPPDRPVGSLRLRCYPWRLARAEPPKDAPSTVWGIELDERELDPPLLTELIGRRPGFALLPIHLLDAGVVLRTIARLVEARVPVIGSDPYAGGRLDGSFLERSPVEHDPRERLLDAKEMRRRFSPVLALGFLTADSGRSLPEAALEFAGTIPGVLATLAPFPTPMDLRRAFDLWGRHPLTVAERARLSES